MTDEDSSINTVYQFGGWELLKYEVEEEVGKTLTDFEFRAVCEEIDGRIENFTQGLVEDIFDQIRKGEYNF